MKRQVADAEAVFYYEDGILQELEEDHQDRDKPEHSSLPIFGELPKSEARKAHQEKRDQHTQNMGGSEQRIAHTGRYVILLNEEIIHICSDQK